MRRLVVLALLLAAAAPGRAAADPVTLGATVLERDAAATCRHAAGPCQPEADVAGWDQTWTHRALAFQYALAGDVGLVDAPWIGTHNSFNSIAEMGTTLSDTDANQQLSLLDQLAIDVRSLELDLHSFAGRQVVCHARGADQAHAGCSIERTVGPVVSEIGGWLRDHRDQVLLLYLEDHLDGAADHDAATAAIRSALGDAIYTPPAGAGCTKLPLSLTRDDVVRAGKQVIVVSGCGEGAAWPGIAFDWSAHVENGSPAAFKDFPDCGPDHTRAVYDSALVRYFEDSTWLSATVDGGEPGGLTPAIAGAMARCGVDLLGMDQLLPHDGRLDALVWSWAQDEPRAGAGDCAVTGAGGRWSAASCRGPALLACHGASWVVAPRCPAGTRPAAPRTGYENQLLKVAAAGRAVRLGLRRIASGWRVLDPRP
jgi:hypothetical protein